MKKGENTSNIVKMWIIMKLLVQKKKVHRLRNKCQTREKCSNYIHKLYT